MADTDIDLSKDDDRDNVGKVPVAVAMAVPVETSFSTSNVMPNQSIVALQQQGFPLGLAHEMGNAKATYPIRFWVVDNSGYVHRNKYSPRRSIVPPCCCCCLNRQTCIFFPSEFASHASGRCKPRTGANCGGREKT